jgi:hypothetical protein
MNEAFWRHRLVGLERLREFVVAEPAATSWSSSFLFSSCSSVTSDVSVLMALRAFAFPSLRR